MANKYEAGGERSRTFNLDEADVLYRNHIPVLPEYRLPHGWHMLAAGYAMPPPPSDGLELRFLIEERRAQMTATKCSQLEWASVSPDWQHVFREERDIEVARSSSPSVGGVNRIGQQA